LPVIEPNTAKKALGIAPDKKVILYFGYLSWYKGADLFFKFAKKMANSNYHFLLAGGPSFTNVHKPHYKKYLDLFINPPKNIQITGFVPEDKISLYFSAADLVVLPYRTMMSSSGPLSLAFSFEKPLVMSEKMKDYVKTKDFYTAMNELKLSHEDIFFKLNNKSFSMALQKNHSQLVQFSRHMKKLREFDTIGKKHMSVIAQLSSNNSIYFPTRITNSKRFV
jgi:glycosyltransferase involved in cell wall biosynthesis